jgi:hypothetical protein
VFCDLLNMTTATGGTGALTLAAVTGWPTIQDIWGSSGTRWLAYNIQEWSGTDHSGPPIKAEAGVGSIVLSTMVLTRTKPTSTWNSTGPTYDGTSPTAISFGTTADNVRVSCSPLAELSPECIPWAVDAAPGVNCGMSSPHAMVSSSTRSGAANTGYFMAFLWLGVGELIQASFHVQTAGTATGVKMAIFEVGSNGLPGNRLLDINNASPATATAGVKSSSISAGFYLPPDWYYAALVANGTVTLRCADPQGQLSPTGTSAIGGPNSFLSGTVTYTTGFGTTAPASLSAGGTGNGPAMYLKARN